MLVTIGADRVNDSVDRNLSSILAQNQQAFLNRV